MGLVPQALDKMLPPVNCTLVGGTQAARVHAPGSPWPVAARVVL